MPEKLNVFLTLKQFKFMKKRKPILTGIEFFLLRKILKIMKLTTILLLTTTMLVSASVYSQSTRLTLKFADITYGELFREIEKQSEFRFAFSGSKLDPSRKIQINATEETLEQILDKALPAGIAYEIIDRYVVILNASEKIMLTESQRKQPQQQPAVSGKVTDSGGQPLPGVTVVMKGTTQGTVTNADGEYTLSNIPEDATLVFSFVGMRTQEVEMEAQSIINVTMETDVIGIDEVVAIGYGVAKKSDLTGAITQVKTEELKKFSYTHVNDLLRTNVAGLNIGYSTSAKGGSSMEIRGSTTLTAGSSPLIVLDGVIYNGDISDINPNDIERVDVLKDASSASVYGSRASNGVIVLTTTQQGTTEKPTITFNSSVGLATEASRMKPYDAEGFIQWRSDMFKSVFSATVPYEPWSPFDDPRTIDPQYLDGWLAYHSTNEDNMVDAWLSGLRFTDIEIENYLEGRTHDWEDDLFQNGLRQDYNISLSGGRPEFTYYWSLGYMNNEALTIGDEFSTIRSRLNIEGAVTSFFKVGLNANFSVRDESSVEVISGRYNAMTPFSRYIDLSSFNKTTPYEDENGNPLPLFMNDDIYTMHPWLERAYRDREVQAYTFFPKVYSILKLPFGITYTMNYSTRLGFNHNYSHNSSMHPNWQNFGGSASRNKSLIREWQIDNIINWEKTFYDVHKFNVTLLANAEKTRYDSEGMSNRGFSPNDVLGYHNMNSGILPSINSGDNVETADALMARINYGYNNKYLLTLSVRRDGSSLFGYANPRATFPAAALGWVLTEEDFFISNMIEYLKLRVSWGANGNRNIANYAALSKIGTGKSLNADQSGSAYTIPTLVINSMSNKKLKWEQTESFNVGIDFNLFDGVLSGSAEGYLMSTTDVLVNRQLPTVTGFSRVYSNFGEVKNKGFELALETRNMQRNNFEWSTNFNFSLNRNKIVSITGNLVDIYDDEGNVIGQKEPDDKDNNWFIGEAKDIIWDYNVLGTWKTGEETEAAEWNQAPGDFILEDVNDDGILTDDDKQFLGYRNPRFRWSMTNNFRFFNNWETSIVMYSLWGHMSNHLSYFAKHDDHTVDRRNTYDVPYWTPDNQLDNYARLSSAPAQGVSYHVWFKKSYIRVENIAVAYRLPQSLLDRTFIKTCRLSFNIRNAGVFAPEWNLGDPEHDTRAQRIFSLGINMTL
jgi:TonB-dependent starch-binding outer membrane protein SusC